MRFNLYVNSERVAEFIVENISAHESGDPVSVTLEADHDGQSIVGIDIQGPTHIAVGHWPDGETWSVLAVINPQNRVDLDECANGCVDPVAHAVDETVGPDGEFLSHGRCDTCGAPCDERGCTIDREHKVAIDAQTRAGDPSHVDPLDVIDYCNTCEAAVGHPVVTIYDSEICTCCGREWGYDNGVCTGRHVVGDIWWQLLDAEQDHPTNTTTKENPPA